MVIGARPELRATQRFAPIEGVGAGWLTTDNRPHPARPSAFHEIEVGGAGRMAPESSDDLVRRDWNSVELWVGDRGLRSRLCLTVI